MDPTLSTGGGAASSAPAPAPAPVPSPSPGLPPAAPLTYPLVFGGTGGEYFRLWIVNLLLTLLTLGVYGAWAKVRRLRYFYGHTTLAGSSFEYHARPRQILIGRLIALALIVPYYLLQFWRPLWSLAFLVLVLIALPFIIVRSHRFHLRMSSWRNVRFNFVGTYGNAAAAYLGWGLLTLLSLGLLAPYADLQRQRLRIAYSRFGGVPFEYGARPGRFYAAYLVALGVGLLAIVALVLLAGLTLAGKSGAMTGGLQHVLTAPGGLGKKLGVVAGIVVFYLAYFIVLFLPYGIIKARTTNESLNSTRLRAHRLHSTLAGVNLWGILVSNLLLVVVTLGLYAPWAKVRLLRYQLQHTSVEVRGSLDDFINEPQMQAGPAAQELGEFMDLDFGL
jgi:uncharacterized membrane protein YjgN (DUF898 family)